MHTIKTPSLEIIPYTSDIIHILTSQQPRCICDLSLFESHLNNKRSAPDELSNASASKRRHVEAKNGKSEFRNLADSIYCGTIRLPLLWSSGDMTFTQDLLPVVDCPTCGYLYDVSVDFSIERELLYHNESTATCTLKSEDKTLTLWSLAKLQSQTSDSDQSQFEQWRSRPDWLFDTLARLYVSKDIKIKRARLVVEFDEEGKPRFHVDFELYAWSPTPGVDGALHSLLFLLFSPPPLDTATGDMDLATFYSALQPPVSSFVPTGMQPEALRPTLIPFQAQAVLWMLNREGMTLNQQGELIPRGSPNHARDLPLDWSKVQTDKGTELLVNQSTGAILTEPSQDFLQAFESEDTVLGGILSEEMGLGKTVEMLALILLHRADRIVPEPSFIPGWNEDLRASGATLIITPNAILSQWISEIKTHAPTLRYFVFDGTFSRAGRELTPADLFDYDIVLTTYPILSKEIHYARKPPDRSRRSAQKYVPRRSPLVQILWWRVLLDEAQMIESTVAKTAEMARLIPRVHPWAVTGTPIKNTFQDLYGLFLFLQLNPIASTTRLSPALFSPIHRATFVAFCRRIMYRNSKQAVRSQLTIPQQHQQVVHVSFSKIELHYYEQLFEQCCQELDLDWLDGLAWTLPDVDCMDGAEWARMKERMEAAKGKMRPWLLRLRQTCCHPTVGSRNQKQLGGALHTVTEVLEVMFRQCVTKILSLEQQLANTKWRIASLMDLQEQFEPALRAFEAGLKMVQYKVKDARERLAEQIASNAQRSGKSDTAAAASTADETRIAVNDEDDAYKNEGDEQEGHIGSPEAAGDEIESIRIRLHNWLETEHRFLFFLASVNHQLKREEQENEFYRLAELVRRELLGPSEKKFNTLLREVEPKFELVKTLDFSFSKFTGGILSWEKIERADNFAEQLNGQRALLDTWRTKIIAALTAKLVNQDADPDGEEYQESLELQESGAVYQEQYTKLLADRRYIITGVWNALQLGDDLAGSKAQKKKTELELELEEKRRDFAPVKNTDPHLKDVVTELRQVLHHFQGSSKEEFITNSELERINREIKAQMEVMNALEKECDDFRRIYNSRINFYRQLQKLSDQVKVAESKDPEGEIETLGTQERELEKQIVTQTSRRRYLEHLVETSNKGEEEMNEEERTCLICRSDFVRGALTMCGHVFCESCLKAWVSTHRKCPTCNGHVGVNEWERIVWTKPPIMTTADSSKADGASTSSSVNVISVEEMSRIRAVKIDGGLGAKLDTIIQHIKYIKQTTGAKCLVFSQWSQVLDLLRSGLRKNHIGCISIQREKDAPVQFREDPDMTVILLHARSQSSGLTLVSAQHVFMCEPLVNLGLESQAINRVHRIGQTQKTYIYWYVAQDTIEERVHAIHEARKTASLSKKRPNLVIASHKGKEKAIDEHSSISDAEVETVDPKQTVLASVKGGGGEHVMDEDLRRCFTKKDDWIVGIEKGDRPQFAHNDQMKG